MCRYNVKILVLNKIHDKILKLSFEYMKYRDIYVFYTYKLFSSFKLFIANFVEQ